MKKYELKERKIVEKTLSEVICNKCGEKIFIEIYNVFDCNILNIRTGDNYPEGGSGDEFTMELCENCTQDMMKLLQENGYHIEKGEWEI